MILLKKSPHLFAHLNRLKLAKRKTGFVPTMGALHQGHISLLKASEAENDVTVCSIFVNPTQFNDPRDFKKYPVTIEQDISLLEQSGATILFLPDVEEMYPNGTRQLPPFPLGPIEHTLEGKYRPGHFQGVCQVMNRLLEQVQPDRLYMGRKDYQQCMVVHRLLQIIRSGTVLQTCPTIREPDGLAMSSRNLRLNMEERKKATAIFGVLEYLKNNLHAGSLDGIINNSITKLHDHQFKVDYVAVTDAITLENVSHWDGKQSLVALIAAYMGEVRLIDNMVITGF